LRKILTHLLKKRMIGGSGQMSRLFDYRHRGPLSSFSAKIEIAYSTGLIPMGKRRDLHNLREIRNKFAHHIEPLDFSDPEIADCCKNLTTLPKAFKDGQVVGRGRYMVSIASLALILLTTTNKISTGFEEVTPAISDDDLSSIIENLIKFGLPPEMPK
jgi:hypothetical protein